MNVNIVLKSILIIIFIILLLKSIKKSQKVVKKEKFSVQSSCNKDYKISDLLKSSTIKEAKKTYNSFYSTRQYTTDSSGNVTINWIKKNKETIDSWPEQIEYLASKIKIPIKLPNKDKLKKWIKKNVEDKTNRIDINKFFELTSKFLDENKKYDTILKDASYIEVLKKECKYYRGCCKVDHDNCKACIKKKSVDELKKQSK